MNPFETFKLAPADFAGTLISELPNQPSEAGLSSEALKARFDAASLTVLTPALNGLIDALSADTASEGLGSAPIEGLFEADHPTIPAAGVRNQLLALKQAIDDLVLEIIPVGTIGENQLINGAVSGGKLAEGAVTATKIAAGAVIKEKLETTLANQVDTAIGVANEIAQATLFPATLPNGRLAELMEEEASAALIEGSALSSVGPETGTYAGLSGNLDNNTRYEFFVTLGYRPSAVLVMDREGHTSATSSSASYRGGLCVNGTNMVMRNGQILLWVTDTGFGVCSYYDSSLYDYAKLAHGTHTFLAWR